GRPRRPVAVEGNALGAVEEVRAPGRAQPARQPAPPAAQLRHAPAGRRRRPAHRAGVARPRQHPDDAAVHARGPRPPQGDPPEVSPAREVTEVHPAHSSPRSTVTAWPPRNTRCPASRTRTPPPRADAW